MLEPSLKAPEGSLFGVTNPRRRNLFLRSLRKIYLCERSTTWEFDLFSVIHSFGGSGDFSLLSGNDAILARWDARSLVVCIENEMRGLKDVEGLPLPSASQLSPAAATAAHAIRQRAAVN
jgi:hypothetical protein